MPTCRRTRQSASVHELEPDLGIDDSPARSTTYRAPAWVCGTAGDRGSHAGTIWLTGISGAGKTTLAWCLREALAREDIPSCVIDGDDLRRGLSVDLEFSRADRAEQARRAAQVALLLAKSGIVAIVALITPYESDRRLARAVHRDCKLPYFEVWVDTPIQMCADRDVKGLYARVRSGSIRGLTAVDAPYEPPVRPDMCVPGYGLEAARIATAVLARALPAIGRAGK